MKILLINEYQEFGGTELQTKREFNKFKEEGHDVLLITFDQLNRKIEGNINIIISKNKFSKFFNKFFVNIFIKKKLKKIIMNYNPDYIHLNNIFGCPKTVYSIVKNYKTIQTIRDYGGVCSKTTCVDNNWDECNGYLNSDCKKCLKTESMFAKIRNFGFKGNTKAKKKSVMKFVCPSQALTDKCALNGYNIVCINNPFDFNKIYVKNKKIVNRKYLYYGLISKIKGIYELYDAFNEFSMNKDDAELVFIGRIDDNDKTFLELIANNPKVSYLGLKKNEEILKEFENVYCTVVPSLWIENYPNTVLESKANSTLVIGTNRGGIVEMIHNDNLLFDVKNRNDIIKKLEYTYNLSEEEYYEIVNKNYEEVIKNNSQDAYYSKIIDIYKQL